MTTLGPVDALRAQGSFAAYDVTHWVVLILLAAGVGVLASFGGRFRATRISRTAGRVFALALVAFHLPILIYDLTPARFDIEYSLPFQISDLTWMVAACALWFRWPWAYALTYYWGLTLVPQALITPALDAPGFPDIDFISFWGQHLLVLWAAVYLTWWIGMRPNWRGFAVAAAVTVGWGLAMLVFNQVSGTNYMFVSRKPEPLAAGHHGRVALVPRRRTRHRAGRVGTADVAMDPAPIRGTQPDNKCQIMRGRGPRLAT